MLSDLFPVLICIYLFPVAYVPIKYDYRRHNCYNRSQPLIVPFHMVEEKTDTLTIAWSVVLTVEELLSQFFKQFALFDFSIVQCTYFVVDSRVEFEWNGIESYINFQILIACFNRGATHWTLLWVLEEKLQDAELAETMSTLHGNGLNELTQANTARDVIIQHLFDLSFDLFLDDSCLRVCLI